MSVHAFISDSVLHTNNKIDPSASCGTSRVDVHFILFFFFFPLWEIKIKNDVLDTLFPHISVHLS